MSNTVKKSDKLIAANIYRFLTVWYRLLEKHDMCDLSLPLSAYAIGTTMSLTLHARGLKYPEVKQLSKSYSWWEAEPATQDNNQRTGEARGSTQGGSFCWGGVYQSEDCSRGKGRPALCSPHIGEQPHIVRGEEPFCLDRGQRALSKNQFQGLTASTTHKPAPCFLP